MKGTVRYPIASIVVAIGLMTLLPHVRIPFIYDAAYRVGAWIGRTFPPAFALPIVCGLLSTWLVFLATSVLYIWGWRPFKKKSAAKNE